MNYVAMPLPDGFPPFGCQSHRFTNKICYSNADRKVYSIHGVTFLLCENCVENHIHIPNPEPPEVKL